MKKFLKRLLIVALCVAVGYCGFRWGPSLYMRLFGAGGARWISERFTETLREKNELVVSEVETTGQETVTQDAWLIGTVQKVVMPYTFHVSYAVDLSLARATADGATVTVSVPKPRAAYHKLTVDEQKMQKSDFLYPLTPERYAEIRAQTEERLLAEYAQNAEYLARAWEAAVRDLEALFATVAGTASAAPGVSYQVRVVMDEGLAPAPSAAPGA